MLLAYFLIIIKNTTHAIWIVVGASCFIMISQGVYQILISFKLFGETEEQSLWGSKGYSAILPTPVNIRAINIAVFLQKTIYF